MRRRALSKPVLFGVIVLICAAAGIASVAKAALQARRSHPPAGVRVSTGASLAAPSTPAVARRAASLAAAGPQLLFRNTIADKTFGKLAVAPLSDPDATRSISNLTCDRAYFAAGRGLCLTATGSGFTNTYAAKIFDASFKVHETLSLTGIPSRARISADGRLGAITVFVNGDSYAPGNFSTRTSLIDMTAGRVVTTLERFKVVRNGVPFHKRNFNFWGVTFSRDDDHFYATLGSGEDTYLVAGSIRSKLLRVISTHVECPSLSPDETRIAYKRSINSHGAWRVYVLDLGTMRSRPVAETNSVDDQVEWLDDGNLLYWRAGDIWSVPANGSGTPAKFVTAGSSPAVIRSS